MGQVVGMCNELAGRVPCGHKQRIRGHLRPVCFGTPSGRVDWDPSNEVCPLECTMLFKHSDSWGHSLVIYWQQCKGCCTLDWQQGLIVRC